MPPGERPGRRSGQGNAREDENLSHRDHSLRGLAGGLGGLGGRGVRGVEPLDLSGERLTLAEQRAGEVHGRLSGGPALRGDRDR